MTDLATAAKRIERAVLLSGVVDLMDDWMVVKAALVAAGEAEQLRAEVDRLRRAYVEGATHKIAVDSNRLL
jgi:hypothetical protein